MRIIYLHQYFVPPDASGGTRSYEFARRLIANGHEVYMITSSANLPQKYRSLGNKPSKTNIEGILAYVIPSSYSNAMPFRDRIREFLRFAILASVEAVQHKADVVFATSTPLTIAIPGILAHLWQRIPMVFEVRDLWPELPIAIGAIRNPIIKALATALELLAYQMSSHIVALSPGMAEGIIKRGFSANKVTVIPNSCDVELFDVPPERGMSIRNQLQLTPDQPLVVYTGAFGLINGVSYLVDIADAMQEIAPDVHFLIVGRGAEREKIIAKAYDHGVLNKNLTIWKPVPKSVMPNIFSAATIATSLFIPLKPMWNNSANKFFDALAAGKPIAINHGGWQANLLEQTGAGIVLPSEDSVHAAQKLASFVKDKEQLRRASEASRTLAYTQFSRDLMTQKLENILAQVAKE